MGVHLILSLYLHLHSLNIFLMWLDGGIDNIFCKIPFQTISSLCTERESGCDYLLLADLVLFFSDPRTHTYIYTNDDST